MAWCRPPERFTACSARPECTCCAAARVAPQTRRDDVVHRREHRHVVGAQPAGEVGERLVRRRGPDRRDVRRLVHRQQLLVGDLDGRYDADAVTLEQPEVAHQLHRQLQADRRERVAGAEVVGDEGVVPHDRGARRSRAQLALANGPAPPPAPRGTPPGPVLLELADRRRGRATR